MGDLTLFDAEPYLVPQAAGTQGEQMSADRHRTVRQALDLAKGIHPLTGGRLHPDAAPAEDRKAAGLRCGTCRFRRPADRWPKCWWPEGSRPLRITHGPATDVRGWWPACRDYQPRESQ